MAFQRTARVANNELVDHTSSRPVDLRFKEGTPLGEVGGLVLENVFGVNLLPIIA